MKTAWKIFWKLFGGLATIITVVTAALMPDWLQQAQDFLRWTIHAVAEPLLPTIWWVAGWGAVLSIMYTAIWSSAALWRVARSFWNVQIMPWLTHWRIKTMEDTISAEEAQAIIRNSDFFVVRQPGADAPKSFGISETFARAIGQHTHSPRAERMERAFLRKLLKSFEEQRPEALNEGRYDKQALVDWLDALFDVEVEEEMGRIPNV